MSTAPEPPSVVRAVVKGRVQGVCFRAYTATEAQRLCVRGWVRNCADGSVEVHMEGDSDALQTLCAWLWEGPPSARVDEVVFESKVVAESCPGFVVRY